MSGKRYWLATLLLMATCAPSLWAADNEFKTAVDLYQKGDYTKACPLFEKAAASNNPTALYYYGVTLHRLNHLKSARMVYERIVSTSPGTPAAALAKQAMASLEPRTTVVNTVSTSRSGGEADLAGPDETRIYFTRERNALFVDASVNNRPIKMLFDTGAETCTFGKNNLIDMGIPVPTGSPVGMSIGVGDQGQVPTWQTNVELKVGNIVRRNFTIDVQEHLAEPLLGQTFFKEFQYTIDNGASCIQFNRKTRGFQTATAYSVPFRREGDSLIVNAEVNGKPIPMIFDTGCSGGVCFSYAHLRTLGISVPDDAEQEVHVGIAGQTHGQGFEIARVKLGPIDRTDFRVSVVNNSGMDHPLIGQAFFSSWQYTIDNSRSVINFVRR